MYSGPATPMLLAAGHTRTLQLDTPLLPFAAGNRQIRTSTCEFDAGRPEAAQGCRAERHQYLAVYRRSGT